MTHRTLVLRPGAAVLAALVAMLAAPECRAAEASHGRPNILFIYADDHSPRMVSCYEHAYRMAHTPNIDALAAGGVRFAAAYLGGWCMPSRASLLTGLHPHSIESLRMEGEYPGSAYDPDRCRFWPAAFRRHGYQTAQIGKWHVGTDAGFGRDWDFQMVWNRPANPDNAGAYYESQVIDVNGERRTVAGYSTDFYTDWACDYIRGEGRTAERPWFLWLCYGAIHGPTIPAERHLGARAGAVADLPADIVGPRPGKPSYLVNTQKWSRDAAGEIVQSGSTKTHAEWLRQAHECLMSVDEGVGRLLEALRESGQLDNTLVIYTSDQGFANGEHGMRQKVAPYEATYASPFVVSMPGTIPAGGVCRQSVNAPDVVVTLFALAGLELPWAMPGRDFTSLLHDPAAASWERPTLYVHTGQEYGAAVSAAIRSRSKATHAGVPYYAAVRQGDLKYVRYFIADEPEELYDLGSDPEELVNRIDDPTYAAHRERLRHAWRDELERAGTDFLDAVVDR